MITENSLESSVDIDAFESEGTLDTGKQVVIYSQWLTNDARKTAADQQQGITDTEYRDNALKTVTIRGRDVSPFAPFRRQFSASHTLTVGQVLVLCLLAVVLVLGIVFYGMTILVIGLAVLTTLYLGDLFLTFLLSMQALNKSAAEQIDDKVIHALADAYWPSYTILCPLYQEVEIVPQFVKAMQELDYPTDRLQILFLTEDNDTETREAIASMHLPPHFEIITVPEGEPRTKPRACNFGLLQARGDYIVIYDAEDIPDPLQIKKAVLTFAKQGPQVACVQAKLNFYNENQNLLTRWFTAEYSLWFDLTLPGMQQAGLPLPLGGTSNHFRAETLRKLGAWDPFNVTEDCDLGQRLARYQLKTAMLDSTTYEEANSQVKNWIRQRSRWIKGYMQTYLVYMRQPWQYLQPSRLREFFTLQLVIGGKTAVLFLNPLMWLLVLVYFLFRPIVGETYRTLFPLPVLYMGTICLVFGNFFYVYSHLIGCLKRRQYSLIKWTLLIPIYWAMTSVAGFYALYQLIFKPHYWEKTKHGLHLLKGNATSITKLEDTLSPTAVETQDSLTGKEDNQSIEACEPAVSEAEMIEKRQVVNVATSQKNAAAVTLELPTTEQGLIALLTQRNRRSLWSRLSSDPWLVATFLVACIASLAALYYYLQQHEIMLYGDALSHMLIARRLFDNATPGLAQLGGVWVPLPHLMMLPFIWNDYLWHTGLAGSLSSMPCYIVAATFIYLAAKRLTKNGLASFTGTLLFICNPNVLYLQVTPLSEPVLIATLAIACYYFLAWTQEDHPRYLVFSAAATFLSTLARFDGWFLFAAFLIFIVLVGRLRQQRRAKIEGNLIIFGSLGCLGVILWNLWCWAIFGDPLYWQRGPFSSQQMQLTLVKAGILYTYHNAWQALRYFTLDTAANVGLVTFILGVIGLAVFVWRRRLTGETVAILGFWMPFVFYVVALYSGQAAIFLPAAVPGNAPYTLYNARYGVEVVAPCAIMVATLIATLVTAYKRRQAADATGKRQASAPQRLALTALAPATLQIMLCVLFAGVIIGQAVQTTNSGIVSLQDGQFGLDCSPTHPIVAYMAQHYNGGKILEDVYSSKMDSLEPEANIHFNNFIYEGSGATWHQALKDPAGAVDWIIMNPHDSNDLLPQYIDPRNAQFSAQFTLMVQEPQGLNLYHRNGLQPLPTNSIDPALLTMHARCIAGHSGTQK